MACASERVCPRSQEGKRGTQIQRFASFHESKKETISVLNNKNEKAVRSVAAAAFSGRTVQQIVVGSLLVVVATAEEGTTSILQRAIQLRAQPAWSIQVLQMRKIDGEGSWLK